MRIMCKNTIHWGRRRRFFISIERRMRARWLHGEWYSHNGVRWFNFGIASPNRHCWWAFTVWVYL